MYFSDITNKELCSLPKPYVNNFSIKLTDILHKTSGNFDNKLFLIEEIITDSIYRIYPLFNTQSIISSNPADKILENSVLICIKGEDETFISFINDENEPVQDYSNYGTYYSIGDSLTTNQYNSVVSLIRTNTVLNDDLHIQTDTIHTSYADYDFKFNGLILDNGIRITDLTQLQCCLTNPVFHYCSYVLELKVLRITNTNVDDETTNNKVIIPISVTLQEGEWVDIPVTDLELEDVILYDCNVNIKFDLPVIPNVPKLIVLDTNKPIIQTGEKSDLTATVYDNGGVLVGSGHTIYFYEEYTPVLTMGSANPIIQSGGKSDIYAILKDSTDGSLISGEDIYFYQDVTNGTLFELATEQTFTSTPEKVFESITGTIPGLMEDNWTLEFDLKNSNNSGRCTLNIGVSSEFDPTQNRDSSHNVNIGFYNNKFYANSCSTGTRNENTYYHMKLVKTGNQFKAYYDGNQICAGVTVDWLDDYYDYDVYVKNYLGTTYVKNISLVINGGS